MTRTRFDVAWTMLLVLGLALSPALALAQKAKPVTNDKVNINTATVDQLQALPGIGPAVAKRILDHRAKHGKFNRIEDLINVQGIGEKKFQKIRDRLVV